VQQHDERRNTVNTTYEPLNAALILNPGSGAADDRPGFAQFVQRLLTEVNIATTLYEVKGSEEIGDAMQHARQGVDLVIACGGDGTLESVANELIGSEMPFGILPAGTRNNLAASLQIPTDLPKAAALLRSGVRRAVDVVHARCGGQERWFVEMFAAGLLSDLFEGAESAQKGNLRALGDMAAKFVGAASSQLQIVLQQSDGQTETVQTRAHGVLAMNTPYAGANFLVADDIRYDDGYLDVFVYEDRGKLGLLAHGVAALADVAGAAEPQLPVRRLRTQEMTLHADPPLPILVDGVNLGEGPVTLRVAHLGLQVITGG
jgi:diacylglycerol kinase family enzyme